MIHIGNQTSCWTATPDEPFEYALASGFDAFEWFPDKQTSGAGWDENDLDSAHRLKIRDAARAAGMRLSVHARWQADPLDEESYPLFWKDLEMAQDLGAVVLNIHLCHEKGIAAYVEAIQPLIRRAKDAGIQLAIENTPHHLPEDFNELFARLGGVTPSSPKAPVGMCLDLGHANLCAATRNDYLKFLDRLVPQVPIIHLHLHENWGDADTHLPLFTGPSGRDDRGIRGLVERLQQRHFSGSIILEQWPQPPTLLNNARNRLFGLIGLQSSGEAISLSPQALASGDKNVATPMVSVSAGEHDFLSALVSADQRCRSWREKLDFIRGLFTERATPLSKEQLVDIAIYLRFLGTGEISCVEDGRHFRPAHHARISVLIQQRLGELTTPDNALIVRRIYPWLPSSAQTFQRAEPLTRIRDIAHRNDIPSELKHEIKHTLQNKLHRCAGPEDLETSKAILARITTPGTNYSGDFVEQFRIFHEELKEFFNARSLAERLNGLLPALGSTEAALVRAFLREKAGGTLAEQLAAFRHLTELREHLLAAAEKQPGSEQQELLLSDIALEDFAFVLLSEMINEIVGPAASLPPAPAGTGKDGAPASTAWSALLDTMLLTIRNLELSRVEPDECRALQAELGAWRKHFDPADRDQLLRLKATADRCRRLAEDYSDRVMAFFPKRVEQVGHALGIAEHAIRVFCDAEIRTHLVFQLSKLVSALLRRLREELNLPAWDVIVDGVAVGRVKAAGSIEELGRDFPEPVIALLKMAEGDEEIPRGVAGLVLAHEIPHLSHLGVRARQVGLVLVACEAPATFAEFRRLEGRMIKLSATAETVKWEAATGPALARKESRPVQIPEVRLTREHAWLPLEEVDAESGGGKADGARRLAELSQCDGAGFKTPPSLVIPFGVMEAALRDAPVVEAEYHELLARIDGLALAEFDNATERLRGLVELLRVPDEIVAEVAKMFRRQARLVVRSSANCEDLEELAGAGLYDSVAGVAAADVALAVRTVWASLWTRRAALSRKQAGIPHERAHMAVLIQQMVAADLSFVLHTVNPISRDPREVYAEIAVGLGETLASVATRGNPWRLVCHKDTGTVRVLAFASFSEAIQPAPGGGVTRRTVDYSHIGLSCDGEARTRLGRRLAAIGRVVEETFGKPQDIEGAVAGDDIFLVQARPQQGLRG